MSVYSKHLKATKETPQSSPIPGRSDQVKNNAGGYTFKVDPFVLLKRFLFLGTEGGTYYVREKEITLMNIGNIIKLLDQDYKRVLDLTAEISKSGRAVKNHPAIVVLALALAHKNRSVRSYAATKFKDIIRIPTHLFIFANYIKKVRGWGRLLREIISDWYLSKEEDQLVYHILKYQHREGWRHLDLLRLAHIKPNTKFQDQLFGWLAGKKSPPKHDLVEAFIKLRETENLNDVLYIVEHYNITWEFVPTKWLKHPEVWKLLLPKLPFIALVRNLGRMSACGAVTPLSKESEYIVSRLRNKEIIKKSKIHPIQAAVAAKTYGLGRGFKGNLTWPVDTQILVALEDLVITSFGNVEKTGKRFFLGLDISGSMCWETCCNILTCMEGAAIMALATVKAEDQVFTGAFSHVFQNFPISKTDTINSVLKKFETGNLYFSATDCAQPMLYALKHKIPADIFVIYTDNETWWGNIHPIQALVKYREKMGIPAKLAVVGMAANGFSIADPNDPYQVDFWGFDVNTPQAISEFAKL